MLSSDVVKAYFASAIYYSGIDMRKAFKAAWHGALVIGDLYLASQGAKLTEYHHTSTEMLREATDSNQDACMFAFPAIFMSNGPTYDSIEANIDKVPERTLIKVYQELVVFIAVELGYTLADKTDIFEDSKYLEIIVSQKDWSTYSFCELNSEV